MICPRTRRKWWMCLIGCCTLQISTFKESNISLASSPNKVTSLVTCYIAGKAFSWHIVHTTCAENGKTNLKNIWSSLRVRCLTAIKKKKAMCRIPDLHTIFPQNNGFPPIIQITDLVLRDTAEVFAGKMESVNALWRTPGNKLLPTSWLIGMQQNKQTKQQQLTTGI